MPIYDQEHEEETFIDMDGRQEEQEIHFFDVEYICEDCDYRWKTKKRASLSEEDRNGTDRWFVDDSNVCCPMCGSFNIARV